MVFLEPFHFLEKDPSKKLTPWFELYYKEFLNSSWYDLLNIDEFKNFKIEDYYSFFE